MSRDHSTAAWTPDWLGESPAAADEQTARPAHAAPDPDDETRELIDLDAYHLADDPADDPADHPADHPADDPAPEPRHAPVDESLPEGPPARDERAHRPLVSEGWAEEHGRPRSDRPTDPAVGSLRSLGAVAVTGRQTTRPPAAPRKGRSRRTGSAYGLVALVLLGLLSAFFAWVTAEPVWLALGHAEAGTVTVTRCTDDRCLGTFAAPGFARDAVPVMGDAPEPGGQAPARMTSDRGARAYVGVDPVNRAALGVALILLCGLGIVRATGVRRLPTRPARRTATLLSLAAPLGLLAAMLAVTY